MSARDVRRREQVAVDDREAASIMEDLIEALNDGIEINTRTVERVRQVNDMRRSGMTWSEIVSSEPRPLVVHMLTESLRRQADAGARFRKAAARVLYSEGTSMDEIAALFGVTRQRVSTLINAPLSEDGTD